MDVVVEQYKELCNDGRHYDHRLWLIPGTAFTLCLLFYKGIYDIKMPELRLVLSLLNILVFSGFMFLFLKDRCFQLENQKKIKQIYKGDLDGFVWVTQYTGHLEIDSRDRWFIRWAKGESIKSILKSITTREKLDKENKEEVEENKKKNRSAANYMFYVMLAVLVANIGWFLYLLYDPTVGLPK